MATSALILLALQAGVPTAARPAESGVVALRAEKALTCEYESNRVIDDAVVLIEDGRIRAIGPASEVAVPDAAIVHDYGDRWLCPGLIDLHSHVGGSRGDINDMVYQLNSELRVTPDARGRCWPPARPG
ncbi:MAG: hypothetical protein AAFP22_18135, partial [Planctomycetota bacterium]